MLLTGCPDDTTPNPGGTAATSVSASGTTSSTSAGPGSDTEPDPTVDTDSSISDPTMPGTTMDDPSAEGSGTTGGGGTTTGGGAESGSTGPVPDCVGHEECDPGFMCENQECVEGCTAGAPCADGFDCCSGECFDLQTTDLHCMACDNACPTPDNIASACEGGMCILGDCDAGFFDCDGMGSSGCESDEMCLCNPGEMQPCYPGPAGTDANPPCTGGMQTCEDSGTAWGACIGFVLPVAEICANLVDDDCNGVADDFVDIDADGWTVCDGDCCEDDVTCSDPPLVNPGAFEYIGNLVDDDCNPLTSDAVPPADCSLVEDFAGVSGTQMAQAMDLCQFTTASPALPDRIWGVIAAELVTPAGAIPVAGQLADFQNSQGAILEDYGTGGVVPLVGPTMAGISSGLMRDQGDAGYVDPNFGTAHGWNGQNPAGYLAANGGSFPASLGCSGVCPSGVGANDGINLRLTIRVPTNALSFRYRFRFFTSEYWSWQCSDFNDFYLALLTTGAAGIPADGNISFDASNNPISVNNGFFDICEAQGCNLCPSGTGELLATGMDELDCNYSPCAGMTGGGTVWLETTAPVVPGEHMVLELMVFDVGDGILDSLSVLDAFEWEIDPSDVGTNPQ